MRSKSQLNEIKSTLETVCDILAFQYATLDIVTKN